MSSGDAQDVTRHYHVMAELAGLDDVLEQFPADVRAAALSAQQAREHLPEIQDVMTQPWPAIVASRT